MVRWQPPIEEKKKVEGGGGRECRASDWDVVEGAAVMPEQRNHLDSACRLVSLVDDAARRDPGSRGGGSGQRLGERNTNQDHHREQRRHCEAHVGDVALERAR